PYGCMGYGDCVKVCDFDAIDVIDGLATVNYEKCVGCGACVAACPRQLIELMPMQEDPMLVIACASHDKAKEVRGYCKVGCVGCTLCAKMAPEMFTIKDNLAVIDYEKYGTDAERDKATGKCPRAMMVYRGKTKRPEPVEEAAASPQD
ncbi:MAG: 4Fe-4S dicluster domain-containing protein, partial [Phycisphaerae bacterium]|nr:4Fe-4S dicluster domain-containing protein [Phycisphaerae bacterium]